MDLKNFGNLICKSDRTTLVSHIEGALKKTIDLFDIVAKINHNNNVLKSDDFRKSVLKAVFLHDLGKISYEFQRKIFNKLRDDKDYVKNVSEIFQKIKDLRIGRHEIYSLIWSIILLDESDKKWNEKIRRAILYHHFNDYYGMNLENGLFLFNRELNIKDCIIYLEFIGENKDKFLEFLNSLGKELKKEVDILEDFKKKFEDFFLIKFSKVKEDLENYENITDHFYLFEHNIQGNFSLEDYEFILLLGFLRRADYADSAKVEIDQHPQEILDYLYLEIINKIGENSWQNKLLKDYGDIINQNIILVAPTGSGKTEFALLWGARNKRKLIFTLPLRVALNDIYKNRLIDGYLSKFKNRENAVGLVHSTSYLENLRLLNEEESIDIEYKETSSRLLSPPIILSTIDQIFLSSLFFYGFDKIFSLFPYSCFIVDEIQSYSPEMMAVIFKTIKHIIAMKGKILIMTATLPPYLKGENIKKIFNDNNFRLIEEEVKNLGVEVKNLNVKRHRLKIEKESLIEIKRERNSQNNLSFSYSPNNSSLEKIIEGINENRKILVIFNNVMKAIKFYEKLEEKLEKDLNQKKNYKLILLHSRLLEKEKRERIRRIKEAGNESIIVVSTQLIEASVDIDFDILHTEISPIDSQIQRWGRIWRNRNTDYKSDKPNIFIYLGIDEDDYSLHISKIIYSSDILEATIKYLENNEDLLTKNVLDYEDEKKLIEKIFSEDLIVKYIEDIKRKLEFLEYFTFFKKKDAQIIFRGLAGRNVVFPQIMVDEEYNSKDREINENDRLRIRQLGEYLLKSENSNSLDIKKIIEAIWGKEINDEKDYVKKKYDIKRWLLEYSINIPEFYFMKKNSINKKICRLGELYIYLDNLQSEKKDHLIKYGLDSFIEDLEIEEMNYMKIN